MRRGVGAARFAREKERDTRFEAVASQLTATRVAQAREHFDSFRLKLQEFALKHRDRINKDPVFRQKFCEMCAAIGVDPLISSRGFWSRLLGVGNFYSELGVQVLTICMATRPQNGGILELSECCHRVRRLRGNLAPPIDEGDIERAIERVAVLGHGGITVMKRRGKTTILSLPDELNPDQTIVLDLAHEKGHVSCRQLNEAFAWTKERSMAVLMVFLREGLVWVDTQVTAEEGGEALYWFPSLALSRLEEDDE
ncbi:unnamed protein product [Vitrella brassicaformis CCMP3155]|uniref:Vacuolar-sorting protein SNF8 n=1 Tax=Vitrella brassicaformis (strain CCMP3155) TaxID=1169540 RepID=A0A0G4H2I4_VITBC|nr:unnamed protein product [Vitrella brassicaformis CCMP3155]|eukprot:CEM37835.1 unnamed protein product [Vitrella brassicaformis CCMP3155]